MINLFQLDTNKTSVKKEVYAGSSFDLNHYTAYS